MAQAIKNQSEVGRLADEIYERELRSTVESRENFGQQISIDLDSHDYEIGEDLLGTFDLLRARHPEPRVFTKRSG